MASSTSTATATATTVLSAKEQRIQDNECSVCIEQINKSSRKRVECGSCDFSACRECYKQYLLNTNDNPHCMNCKRDWDQGLMLEKFDKHFLNVKYKLHRENVLIDRERSKMVATQPYVERILENRKLRTEISVLDTERRIIESKIREISSRIKSYNPNVATEKKQFIRKCMGEECKGFLSSQWKCGMCNHWSCPECHVVVGLERNKEITGIEHECNADTLATAKLLDSDTKQCPTCSVGIFKIDGCDMMFCVDCHTSFSWKTGKIETGIIHNPHYFEWLKNGGKTIERNPNEVRCGRELDHYFVERLHRALKQHHIEIIIRETIVSRCRYLIHTRLVTIIGFERIEGYEDNRDLRIEFMLNELSDELFKKKLQQREKQNLKKQEYINLLGMFVNCQTEIFYRIENVFHNAEDASRVHNNQKRILDLTQLISESERLTEYTNDCLMLISKKYKSTKYKFNNEYRLD